MIENPPVKLEDPVQPLGPEDSLEKEMAAHFRILAWRIPWKEEPGGVQSMVSQRVRHNWASNTFTLSIDWKFQIEVTDNSQIYYIKMFLLQRQPKNCFRVLEKYVSVFTESQKNLNCINYDTTLSVLRNNYHTLESDDFKNIL